MKKIIIGALVTFFSGQLIAQAQSLPTVGVDGKKIQVLNLDSKGRVPWGGYTQIGNTVRSASDGVANTKAIIAAIGSNAGFENKPYAASLCSTLKANGHEDWYLPSVNELKGIRANFKAIGLGEKNTYWSSTEVNGTQSVAVYMYDGTLYNNAKVNDNNYACVRKAD